MQEVQGGNDALNSPVRDSQVKSRRWGFLQDHQLEFFEKKKKAGIMTNEMVTMSDGKGSVDSQSAELHF